jgi:hypothetical protein
MLAVCLSIFQYSFKLAFSIWHAGMTLSLLQRLDFDKLGPMPPACARQNATEDIEPRGISISNGHCRAPRSVPILRNYYDGLPVGQPRIAAPSPLG